MNFTSTKWQRILRGARQRVKAQNGRCEGNKPYGTFAGEQEVIDRMKELRQGGLAVDTIAETLNAEGIKPRAGAQWHSNTVYRILKVQNSL